MKKPYVKLGGELKLMRVELHESIAEVSGAVEIDTIILERIEAGHERPSEDILMLLINHFGLQDDKAVELWELAGYDKPQTSKETSSDVQSSPLMIMMAIDARVLYTDKIKIQTEKSGVVLNFLQKNVSNNQSVPVARIGMSLVQAQELLKSLHQSLVQQSAALRQPKQLPAPKNHSNKSKHTEQK